MALPFGVYWLYTLLLWTCICFSLQKGYNIAHGYSLKDDEFSSHAGVLGPQPSNQFNPGASLNTDQKSISPRDEMQPAYHENNEEDASSVTSLSEERVQSKPPAEEDVSSAPPLQNYEREGAGYQHPFGLLVREHTQDKTEGTSFSTIQDFKRFIEKMKSSFLMPGSDLGHFQTAREIMEKEIASENHNINREPDTSYRSNSAREGTAYNDASENEVWSEAMNTVFEQSEQGANYQSESLSVPDPVDSTQSLISTSVYNGQESGPGSALYPPQDLTAAEHVSSNYGSFDSAGISRKKPDSSPHVQNEDFQSTSYQLPEQTPSGSFFGEDLSFSGHVTASRVNPPNSPSQDFSDYSSKKSNIMPPTSENNIQQPTYTSHSKDSFTGYHKPSGGFEIGKDFKKEELGRVPPANVLSAAPILSSYGHSVYVSAPRRQHYIPDYVPKQRKRPAQSFQTYQPTVDKVPKDINYTPTAHLPGSGSPSSDDPSPQSSSGHVGVQTSSPHDAQNQAFSREQPDRLIFTAKPSSSRRQDGFLRDQMISVSRPSSLTALAEEKSDLSSQGPKHMADNTLTPISSGLDLTQSAILSQFGVGDWNFNSLTNLAPTSASERAFSGYVGNEIMSRNFGIKDIISHIRGAKNTLGSFSTPLRQGISLNGGYVSATRAGLPQTFIQPTKVWKRPANVNKESGNMAYWPPKPLSASKVSASTLSGVFWRNGGNTKRLPPQAGPNMSPPSVKAYIVKSRNGYVRGKASLSKTSYAPYQLEEYKNTMQKDLKKSKGGSM